MRATKPSSPPTCQKMGTTIFLYLDNALVLAQLLHSSQGKWAEGSAVATKTGLCAEPGEVPARTHCQEFTHFGLVFNTQNMTLSLPQDKVLSNKGPGNQSGLLPYMKRR